MFFHTATQKTFKLTSPNLLHTEAPYVAPICGPKVTGQEKVSSAQLSLQRDRTSSILTRWRHHVPRSVTEFLVLVL